MRFMVLFKALICSLGFVIFSITESTFAEVVDSLGSDTNKQQLLTKCSTYTCAGNDTSCVHTFCFDFSDPHNLPQNLCNRKSNYIRHGQVARFQVVNVNPFLYTTAIDASIVEYKSDIPAGITSFLLPESDYIPMKGLSVTGIIDGATPCDPVKYGKWACRYQDGLKNTRSLYENFKMSYDSVKASEILDKQILLIAQEDYKTYAAIRADVDTAIKKYFNGKLYTLNREEILAELISKGEIVRKLSAPLIDSCDLMIRIIDSIGAEKKIPTHQLPDKKFYENIKSYATEANKWVTRDYYAVINSIVSNYTRLDKNNFVILSAPIVAEKDEIVFTVNITPKAGLAYNTPARSLKYDYTIWVKGGTKLIFSSGPVMSLGLRNQVFSYYDSTMVMSEPDSSYQVRIIRKQNNELPDAGIAALMHLGWRCGYGFYPAATIGAMIDLSGKLRFLAGGSLIFGARERFILNGGVAYGAVEHLSSDYVTDRVYAPDNLPDAPPVYDKFKWGGYLGVTFSFGFTKNAPKIGTAGGQ